MKKLMIISAVCLIASGCATANKLYEPRPVAQPQVPVMPAAMASWRPAPAGDGSLWNAGSVNPFSDDKASRRGDLVMVRVNQKTVGTKEANTDTSRKSSITAKIKYWLGLEDEVNKLNQYTQDGNGERGTDTWNPTNLIDATSERSFKGSGSTKRTDAFIATVSAVVTDVMANGNLKIYGTQNVMVNNEASMLTIQGIVRPSDLDVENAIDSIRIAEAQIAFNGSGVVSDPQHPGWMNRVFDAVWPF